MNVDTTNSYELSRLSLKAEIEDFLISEAALLDSRSYKAWLDLFTEDLTYTMPLRRNIKFGEWEREFTDPETDVTWFADTKASLEMRVDQILTGVHWAEEPSSRTVHLVSNVQIAYPSTDAAQNPNESNQDSLSVVSCFLTYRNRVDTETDIFAGKRFDRLTKVEGRWLIRSRRIELAQSVLLAKNLTLFL